MSIERHDTAFIVGAVLGAVAGSVAALWNAPQSGARTRAQLSERRDAMVTQIAEVSSEAEGGARQILARADEQATAVKDRVVRRTETASFGDRPREGEFGGAPASG